MRAAHARWLSSRDEPSAQALPQAAAEGAVAEGAGRPECRNEKPKAAKCGTPDDFGPPLEV